MNRPSVLLSCAALLVASSQSAWPGESVRQSGQALQHSVQAVGHAFVAGAQLVSGVAAIPLGAAGAVGRVSGEMSDELWRAANTPAGEPLPITDDVVTAGPPPAEALRDQEDESWPPSPESPR